MINKRRFRVENITEEVWFNEDKVDPFDKIVVWNVLRER